MIDSNAELREYKKAHNQEIKLKNKITDKKHIANVFLHMFYNNIFIDPYNPYRKNKKDSFLDFLELKENDIINFNISIDESITVLSNNKKIKQQMYYILSYCCIWSGEAKEFNKFISK